MTRRRLLLGITGGGVLAGGALTLQQALSSEPSQPSSPSMPGAASGAPAPVPATHLQIIAHADDDLYFFTPDLSRALLAGDRVVTVCLTSGEADGKNVQTDDPTIRSLAPAYEEYSAARYTGLRSAYAHVAVGDRDSRWRREAMAFTGGPVAELSTLEAAPRLQLIFFNMWTDGERRPDPLKARLRDLWADEVFAHPTMRTAGSPVPNTYVYSRDSLINALVMLLETYRPPLVRTMDPDPDYQVHDANNPQYSDYGDFSDHVDHTPAGLFAWAALQEWWRRGHGRQTVVESYRGYYNRRWPANLSPAAAREKMDIINVYTWADGRRCGDPAGCGDRKVGKVTSLAGGYGQSTTHRYTVSAAWLGRGADGKLNAFAVLGGQAVRWVETAPGSGLWSGPSVLGGDQLLPHLAAAPTAGGRWQVFGVRMVLDADPSGHRRDIVTTVLDGDGTRWTNLGNPHTGSDGVVHRGVGMPAVSVDAAGRLHLFVRNFATGVSSRVQDSGGGWRAWSDLKGSGTQDGLTAVSTRSGRIQLFASAKTGILRWYQKEPNGTFNLDTLSVPPPAGPPAVAERDNGRLTLLVRQADTAAVLAYQQAQPDGRWADNPLVLGGHGGFGPLAAAACPDGTLIVAQRNDVAAASLAKVGAAGLAKSGDWVNTSLPLVHAPAVAADASGRVVLAALCADGRLRVARQKQPGGSLELTAWTVAGG